MSERVVNVLVAILPLLSAALYLLGFSYHQGYLAAFGVDESLYPLALDRALFTGLLAFIGMSFPAVAYALGALCALVIALLVATILSSTASVRSITLSFLRRLPGWRLSHPPSETASALLDRSFVLYGYGIGIVAVLVSLLAMAALSSARGREQAEREISDHKSDRGWTTQVSTRETDLPPRVKLLVCGEHWCSFWSEVGAVTVPRSAIAQMRTARSSMSDASEPEAPK
jgi:hypothetical protein